MIKIVLMFLIFLCIGFSTYKNYTTESSLLYIFSSILFCFYLYKKNKISFFIILQFIIVFLWCCFSLFYIEEGNFISEQKIFGENIGSLGRYLLFYMIFMYSIYRYIDIKIDLDLQNEKKIVRIIEEKKNYFFRKITLLIFLLVLGGSFIIFIFYGIPVFNGMSRFEFYKIIHPLEKIIFFMPVVSFLFGVLYAQENRKSYIFSIMMLVTLLIFFSDKFSGIYGVILYFVMGFYVSKNIILKNINYGINAKVLFVFFPLVSVFFLSIVIWGYINLHGASYSDLYERILSRTLALQAHVWYGIDYRMHIGALNFDPKIFFLQSNEPSQPAGLEYLMYEISDKNFVDSFREAGIRFTNGYPAIVLISFGYFYSACILYILGLIVAIFLYYVYLKIKLYQPIRLMIAMIFYNNIIINIFVMGEIYYFYKILGIIIFIIFIFDCMILRHRDFKVYTFMRK